MINFFKKEDDPKDLKEILKQFNELKKEFQRANQEIEFLKKESLLFIKKVEIIRYNPFSNVGGDQSFSIALLDSNNNGAVITSLYAEGSSRVYGKPVAKGSSKHSLSEEEKKVLKKAMASPANNE